MTSGGIRSGATARSASRCTVGSRTGQPGVALPGRPQHRPIVQPVGLDERRDRLGTHPGHPRRPEQDGGRIADLGQRQVGASHHLPGGPASAGAGSRGPPRSPGAPCATAPSGSGETTIDRQRAAGPGDVREPPDARLALVSASAPSAEAREDDGGDGHAWPMSRYVTRSVPEPDRFGRVAEDGGEPGAGRLVAPAVGDRIPAARGESLGLLAVERERLGLARRPGTAGRARRHCRRAGAAGRRRTRSSGDCRPASP